MKKFKYALLSAVVALAGFTSCSNDDVTGEETSTPKTVTLKITQDDVATYGESAAQGATPVVFATGELFFANAGGTILGRYTITNAASSATNINMTDITGATGAALTNLNGTITQVLIVGNVPAGVNLGALGTLAAVKATALDVQTQSNVAAVNLFGEGALVAAGGDNYTVTVGLKPTVARIELTDMVPDGAVTAFEVAGVFVDNYYAQGNIDGTLVGTATGFTQLNTDYADNSGRYPTALTPSIYDWYAVPLAIAGGKVAPAGGVWAYNLFATAAGSDVPRIVVRLKNVVLSGVTLAADQFVSIKGLQQAGTALAGIKAGEVYNVGTGLFKIDETVITPDPNQNTINVEVKVTVASWVPVAVTPEL